jgi:hypothetical protein
MRTAPSIPAIARSSPGPGRGGNLRGTLGALSTVGCTGTTACLALGPRPGSGRRPASLFLLVRGQRVRVDEDRVVGQGSVGVRSHACQWCPTSSARKPVSARLPAGIQVLLDTEGGRPDGRSDGNGWRRAHARRCDRDRGHRSSRSSGAWCSASSSLSSGSSRSAASPRAGGTRTSTRPRARRRFGGPAGEVRDPDRVSGT